MSSIIGRAAFRASRPLRSSGINAGSESAASAAGRQQDKSAITKGAKRDPELYVRHHYHHHPFISPPPLKQLVHHEPKKHLAPTTHHHNPTPTTRTHLPLIPLHNPQLTHPLPNRSSSQSCPAPLASPAGTSAATPPPHRPRTP